MNEINAVKKAIPTSRHAELLFDLVLDYLQERAFVVSADQGGDRTIYLRDETGSWIAPWPLLRLTLGRRGSFVGVPGELSNEVPEESGAAPSRLKNLQGGEIEILGAEGRFAITFASDGQACETSRTGDETVAALARALEVGGGNPVDLLAHFIASRNAQAEAPGRVLLPEGAAVGLMTAWLKGLAAMRRALFFTSAPAQGTWLAADGYAGTAIGCCASREEALEACREQVRLLKPVPPEPRKQPEISAEVLAEMGFGDAQLISAPAEDGKKGAATTENTPIVMTRVPVVAEKGDRSVVLLDEKGRAYGASVFEREGGPTIIGHGVIDQVDLGRLEERIEAAIVEWNERQGPEPPWPEGLPPLRSKSWLLDLGKGGDLRVSGSSATPEFDPGALDGAQLHGRVLRQKQTPAGGPSSSTSRSRREQSPNWAMMIESFHEHDRDLIRRVLEACTHGPFFDEWEFHTLFGLTRSQFGEAAHRWTEEGEVDAEVEVAIRNAIVNLVGYPHGLDEVLEVRFEVDRGRLEELLRRLPGS